MNIKFLLFLLIAVAGNCSYHIGQKSLHTETANPMFMLSVFYGLSMMLCILAIPLFGKVEISYAATLLSNWRAWLVSFGIMFIELGFLLAYQAGGSAQWGGVAVNGAAALLLIPLSIVLFHEHFSWSKVLGIVITLTGLYILVRK
ncbi:hypothetical protein [Wielerella bovis]|uniref:hypothetical protein n=1 Tax=Wielerella bovis TaxID=2917790 RepID=UPI002018DDFB|nr:hypothetical protein [Wielerella bovis]MCG7657006.1 hypothetical protein [Wielerella bovis]MCG7659229.1 hypothetical protein [Wielerella bovis]